MPVRGGDALSFYPSRGFLDYQCAFFERAFATCFVMHFAAIAIDLAAQLHQHGPAAGILLILEQTVRSLHQHM